MMTDDQLLERINFLTEEIAELKSRGEGGSPLRQELFEELVQHLRAINLSNLHREENL